MNTPIADFVKQYAEKNMSRLHMPGHKGKSFLGCEQYDITEVSGADALYEAEGIIAESEENAAKVFGTARTVYSAEGSSQCIRAMLYLAISHWKEKISRTSNQATRPVIAAARNVHKAFVYAAALLDFDVVWLWPEQDVHSICACPISAGQLEDALTQLKETPAAVYVTSPDYLGGQQDIAAFAKVCHDHGTILAVDNAHGAYLHFTKPAMHPMDLGADICCDSAHKTLPVLTGGAYLQISKDAPESFVAQAKHAMALFGSTSPSYLILSSLDLCNKYLTENYGDSLKKTCAMIQKLRNELKRKGWRCEGTEPLKLTVRMPEGLTGTEMAEQLRLAGVECEFADPDYLVFMFTPENEDADYQKVEKAFGENNNQCVGKQRSCKEEPHLYVKEKESCSKEANRLMSKHSSQNNRCKQKLSIRQAIFAPHEEIPVTEACDRICGTPTVSCPPAIPILVSGEEIDQKAIELFQYYGVETVEVVKVPKYT